jgi:hypothetical protein
MCPLTKGPCSNNCWWFTKLFTDKDGKEYYGCIVEKIEMDLDSIAGDTASINISMPMG